MGLSARCYRCRAFLRAHWVAEEEVQGLMYLGESSRSLPTRQGTHVRDYGQDLKKKRKKNEEEAESGVVQAVFEGEVCCSFQKCPDEGC